jgi:Coenzyme PQQ synthesis protein D (PqqD)
MIGRSDRLTLPDGVRIDAAGLYDPVRGVTLPLNPVARAILSEAARGATIEQTVSRLRERYGIGAECATRDVLSFVALLNARLLLNITPSGGEAGRVARNVAGIVRSVRLLSPPRLFMPPERYDVPTARPLVAPLAVVRRLAPRAVVLGVLVALTLAMLVAPLGAPQAFVATVALAGGLAAALVVHEAGHALLLPTGPASLGIVGLRIFIMHRPVGGWRRSAIAAAGPLLASVAGWLLLLIAAATALMPLTLFALPLASQSLALTIASSDGRKTCGLS